MRESFPYECIKDGARLRPIVSLYISLTRVSVCCPVLFL